MLLVGAMITGTAFTGLTGAAAAPIAAAAPVGKAIAAEAKSGLVQQVRHRHRHHRRHRHGGAGIALGAAGLFLGLSALAAHSHYRDPYYYDGPIDDDYGPWSPSWFDYCSSRFKTFNPRTGYYKGYDGEYHFCR
jgi:hypothetical protein